MAKSALGEPYRRRSSASQCSNTRRMQISAICESSPVVSSSGATFASSRSATRVISRPFQKRSAAKSCVATESPARACSSLSISVYPRAARHTFGWESHKNVSGFLCQSRGATARNCEQMQQCGFAEGKLFDHVSQRCGLCRPSLAELNQSCLNLRRVQRCRRLFCNPAVPTTHCAKHHAVLIERPVIAPYCTTAPKAAREPATLFSEFEPQPDSCRPIHRRVPRAHPARSLHAGVVSENIHPRERECRS